MAFFKFRKRTDEPSALPVPPESIDVMRKRAKHRLLGAALLVLVGVLGFPLLFDKQPRPIAVDIPIEIPDRAKVKPLSIPAPAVAPRADEPAPVASATSTASAPTAPAAAAAPPQPVASDSIKPVVKTEPATLQKPASATANADNGGRAQALLDGRDPPAKVDAAEARFVVQVGAFADLAKAREVRQKLEQAGLKTYTQVLETKDGRRIRVRVGPFAGKSEADKAAEKIKKLNLPAATLSL
ncbi:MAG: SPOR domain-containing protein [Comamonadaceae bacterium]|nr:MAG: SPOR domain-containing protein [Comamonadaceae bacterium]